MKSALRCLLGGLLLVAGASLAHAQALPPGISGTWHNPLQSGHGLSITVHSPDDALVFWHTGDSNGNPLLLYSEARFDGSSLRGDALESRGIRFGSFNPADNRLTRWGDIELELQSCERLILRYNANGAAGGAAYGSGAVQMHKLAGVDGMPCTDALPTVGLFEGQLQVEGQPSERFEMLLSADGSVFLSLDRGIRAHGALLIGTVYPGPDRLFMDLTAYREPSPHRAPQTGAPLPSAYDVAAAQTPVHLVGADLRIDSRLRGYVGNLSRPGSLPAAQLSVTSIDNDESAAASYRRDVSIAALAGRYLQVDNDAWITYLNSSSLTVAADGSFFGSDRFFHGARCFYVGQLRKSIAPSIEFESEIEVRDCGDRDGRYRGKAWVSHFDTRGKPASLQLSAVRRANDAYTVPVMGDDIAFQLFVSREDRR